MLDCAPIITAHPEQVSRTGRIRRLSHSLGPSVRMSIRVSVGVVSTRGPSCSSDVEAAEQYVKLTS
jgi:hypothetical protein